MLLACWLHGMCDEGIMSLMVADGGDLLSEPVLVFPWQMINFRGDQWGSSEVNMQYAQIFNFFLTRYLHHHEWRTTSLAK